MKKIFKASEFEDKFVKIVNEVAATGEKMVIMRDGIPLAELVPALDRKEKQRKSIIGAMKDSIVMYDDLIEPVDVEWDALK